MFVTMKRRALFTLLVFILTFSVCKSRGRVSFGEKCDKAYRCDSRASLTCSNGICECVKEAEMTFDISRKKCVVLSGEKCSYTSIQFEDEAEEKSYTEKLDCVENALCMPDGHCGCTDNFFENNEGSCTEKAKYGERCFKHEACSLEENLICDGSVCSCNATEATFDSQRQQCVAKAGVSAAKYYRACVLHASNGVNDSYCVCDLEYMRTLDGTCAPKLDFSEACYSNEECRSDKNLACFGGRCDCNGTEALYDFQRNQCVAKVGVSVTKYGGVCVLHATSVGNTSNCICDSDYTRTVENTCSPKLSFNESCKMHDECRANKNLFCLGGRCNCNEEESIYDFQRMQCVAKAGVSAVEFGGTCVPHASRKGNTSSCVCDVNYFRTLEGFCQVKLDFNQSCNTNNECRSDKYLVCQGEKCDCNETESAYDSQTKQCVAKVGMSASKYGGACVSHASDLGNFTRCACHVNYFKTLEGFCVKKLNFNESCRYNEECSSHVHLICVDGKCNCNKTEAAYDSQRMQCVAKVGMSATKYGGACVMHSSTKGNTLQCACSMSYRETFEGLCAPKLDYNEVCSKTDECSSRKNLVCLNRRCNCNVTESIYDSQRKQCVAKIGVSALKYRGACVMHSSPDYETLRCGCSENYLNTTEGTCAPIPDFGDTCSYTSQCRKGKQLHCIRRKCGCLDSNWLYNSKTCVVKAGAVFNKAYFSSECVRGAGTYSSYGPSDTCRCIGGRAQINGVCKGRYNDECNPISAPCSDELVCSNGICSCPYPDYQFRDYQSHTCRSHLHGPCSETINGKTANFLCGYGMECILHDEISECVCAKGYVESMKGESCELVTHTVALAYGSDCQYASQCDHGLACRNSRCSCRDFEEYDGKAAVCVALVGGKCGLVSGRNVPCTINAACVPARNITLPGTCRCSGFVGPDRKCVNAKS